MRCRKRDSLPTNFKPPMTKIRCWENLLASSVSWDTFPYTEKFAASLNRTRRSRVILYSIVWVVNINLLG